MAPAPQVSTDLSTNSTSSSGGNGGTDNFSNELALAALVLGAGAFVIAFLQMIYQYYYSDLRDKCSSGAIGRWHFHVRTEWDIRNWRPRVLYPEVSLDIGDALKARDMEDRKVLKLFKGLQNKGYKWVNVAGGKHGTRLFYVEAGGWVLKRIKDLDGGAETGRNGKEEDEEKLLDGQDGIESVKERERQKKDKKVVRIDQLPPLAIFEWCRFLFHNPRHSRIAARTSWANMLECLDVDPNSLVLKRQSADIIPSKMDGPLQCTKLTNIGLWCFVFGMRQVKLDYIEGRVEASNQYARLSTTQQDVPGMSNVICLEGDLDGLEGMIDEATTAELRQTVHAARGSLNFISFRTSVQAAEPLFIVQALDHGWTSREYRAATNRVVKQRGNLIWEASSVARIDDLKIETTDEEWKEIWKNRNGSTCPSIIQLLAFLPFHNICSGYPHQMVLSPYQETLEKKWRQFWESNSTKAMCFESEDHDLVVNKDHFLRQKESFLLMTLEGRIGKRDGAHSWIFKPIETYYLEEYEKPIDKDSKGVDPAFRSRLESIIVTCDRYTHRGGTTFPIHPLIWRLLNQETLDKLRKEVQISMSNNAPCITVEAAMWFTLFTLDILIEAIWGNIEGGFLDDEDWHSEAAVHIETGDDSLEVNLSSEPPQAPAPVLSPSDVEAADVFDFEENGFENTKADFGLEENVFANMKVDFGDDSQSVHSQSSQDTTTSHNISLYPDPSDDLSETILTQAPPKVNPHLSAFLGLWLAICRKTDPFSSEREIFHAFDSVLKEWDRHSSRNQYCTEIYEPEFVNAAEEIYTGISVSPSPHQAICSVVSSNGTIGRAGVKKGQFVAWVKQDDRKALVKKLLPWLQLRTVLMYHYILCHEDSSMVARRHNIEPIARVA